MSKSRRKKIEKWLLLEETDISPSTWFPLYKHTVQLPNGKIINDYYLSKLADVVMILPITKKREVLFVKQYKHGAGEIIIELPAGMVKDKYDIKENALIELKEETGFNSKCLIPLGYLFGSPTKSKQKVYGFIATNLFGNGVQEPDQMENIQVVKVPISKLDNFILKKNINSPDSIAFIRLAQLKYPQYFL